jgi:hypothetical protein
MISLVALTTSLNGTKGERIKTRKTGVKKIQREVRGRLY